MSLLCPGNTALHWACQQGHEALVKVLVQNFKADASCHNKKDLASIHLAITGGHSGIVKILLDDKKNDRLVDCLSPSTGLYPIHVAALSCQLDCAKLLIDAGAQVNRLTEKRPQKISEDRNLSDERAKGSEDQFTVFHLAASGMAQRRFRKYNDKLRGEDPIKKMKDKNSVSTTENLENDQKTVKLLDLFLDHLPSQRVDVVTDSFLGSVLHYFAAIDYVAGIEKLVGEPYFHPADELNKAEYSPLLIGLHNRSMGAVSQLLRSNLNVARPDPKEHLTPLQLLIKYALEIHTEHLEIVDQLLEKGMQIYFRLFLNL